MMMPVNGPQAEKPPSEWPDLEEFLSEFVRELPPPLVRFFRAHVRGQLEVFRDMSVRTPASKAGISGAYFSKLLKDPRWDEQKLLGLLSTHIQRGHGKRLRGLLIEQSRRSSRPENKIREGGRQRGNPPGLTHLVLAERGFCCILDSDPGLPPGSSKNSRRRDGAPWLRRDFQEFRSQGALDLILRAKRGGIRFDWLLLGAGHGAETGLLQCLAEEGQRFIAEVSDDVTGWLYHPLIVCAQRGREGGLLRNISYDTPLRPSRSIKELTAALPPSQEASREITGGIDFDSPWQARILPFYAQSRGLPTDPMGLLILRNRTSRESRYFLGNGFLGVSLESATRIALSKDSIERTCLKLIAPAGLGDSRARSFSAYKRYLALSTLAILFRAERSLRPAGSPGSPKGSP